MRWRALLSLLALLWLFVLVALAVAWGPFAPASPAPMFSPGPRPVVPSWINQENLPSDAVPGAKLFAVAGCTACHTYAGVGSANLGGDDLTAIGSRQLGVGILVRHLSCPSCVNSGSPMPSYASLGNKRLRQLGNFLEASKGLK